MALAFEIVKNLTADADQNIEPYYVRTPYLIHEHDNSLFQYYIQSETDLAWDKRADVSLGQYKVLPWVDPQHHLTTRAVSKIGAKQFPQIGAIGFYKDLYTSQSYILVPVHDKQKTFKPPTIDATLSDSIVKLTITPPKDITYSCYKIIMRSGYFAVEYVVYNPTTTVAAPLINGTYEVTAIGYNELTGVYSSTSNVVNITVTNGRDSWEPEALQVYLRLRDLVDVNLVDLLNAQMLRFNAETQKWENVDATALGASRTITIALTASMWITESDGRFYQNITVNGLTKYSKVDLQPNPEQLTSLRAYGITLTTKNSEGALRVYAVGVKPIESYVLQATVTEVSVNG